MNGQMRNGVPAWLRDDRELPAWLSNSATAHIRRTMPLLTPEQRGLAAQACRIFDRPIYSSRSAREFRNVGAIAIFGRATTKGGNRSWL